MILFSHYNTFVHFVCSTFCASSTCSSSYYCFNERDLAERYITPISAFDISILLQGKCNLPTILYYNAFISEGSSARVFILDAAFILMAFKPEEGHCAIRVHGQGCRICWNRLFFPPSIWCTYGAILPINEYNFYFIFIFGLFSSVFFFHQRPEIILFIALTNYEL